MEGNCDACFKPLGNEICLFDNKKYHKACCQFCKGKCKPKTREQLTRRTIEPIVVKETSPKPLIPQRIENQLPELKKPTKMKLGPGRLNFALFDNLANMDVKCYTCNLIIHGQRFLSKKIGQFNCWDCHYKLAPKCTMCKKIFETNQVIFKDENQLQYCDTCINIHYNELRKERLNQMKQSRPGKTIETTNKIANGVSNSANKISIAVSTSIMKPQIAKVIRTKSKSKSPSKSPHNSSPTSPLMSPKNKNKKFNTNSRSNSNENSQKSSSPKQRAKITIQNCYRSNKKCDACLKQLTTKVISFKGSDYHENCFTCSLCKKMLSNQLFYEDKASNQFGCCEKCYLANGNSKRKQNNLNKRCTICNFRLNEMDSFFIDKYSKCYCVRCFTSVKSKACVKCLNTFQISNQSSSTSSSEQKNNDLKQLMLQIDNKHHKLFKKCDANVEVNDFMCSWCDH